MDYRALDDRLEAKWLLFLAALSAAGVAVSLFTGMLDLLRFTFPFFLACAFGAFVMTPSLRFRYSRWAQDGFVFANIRKLPNAMRWVLTIHPSPRFYLARQVWRLTAASQFVALGECDAIANLGDADLKQNYAAKLRMLAETGQQNAETIEELGLLSRSAWKLIDEYGFDAARIQQLAQAVGSTEKVLSMLESGIPAEYVLAMGGAP